MLCHNCKQCGKTISDGKWHFFLEFDSYLQFKTYVEAEAVVQRCSVKKVFLKISQKNTCTRVSLLKKRLWHRCFSVNFAKLSRAPFLIERLCGGCFCWREAYGLFIPFIKSLVEMLSFSLGQYQEMNSSAR